MEKQNNELDTTAEFWTTYLKSRRVSAGADVSLSAPDVANMVALLGIARSASATANENRHLDDDPDDDPNSFLFWVSTK